MSTSENQSIQDTDTPTLEISIQENLPMRIRIRGPRPQNVELRPADRRQEYLDLLNRGTTHTWTETPRSHGDQQEVVDRDHSEVMDHGQGTTTRNEPSTERGGRSTNGHRTRTSILVASLRSAMSSCSIAIFGFFGLRVCVCSNCV